VVELTYVFGGFDSFCFDSNSESKVIFNILPYILNCFFKCKINYTKNLSQLQYDTIRDYIEDIKNSPKHHFDLKDIISVNTVKELFDILEGYGRGSLEWI
jgi:hypothetical protein